jgi:hypothetical protein
VKPVLCEPAYQRASDRARRIAKRFHEKCCLRWQPRPDTGRYRKAKDCVAVLAPFSVSRPQRCLARLEQGLQGVHSIGMIRDAPVPVDP